MPPYCSAAEVPATEIYVNKARISLLQVTSAAVYLARTVSDISLHKLTFSPTPHYVFGRESFVWQSAAWQPFSPLSAEGGSCSFVMFTLTSILSSINHTGPRGPHNSNVTRCQSITALISQTGKVSRICWAGRSELGFSLTSPTLGWFSGFSSAIMRILGDLLKGQINIMVFQLKHSSQYGVKVRKVFHEVNALLIKISSQMYSAACGRERRWAQACWRSSGSRGFVCLSASPRCEPHKYPSGSLANDLATPALHSINISLKSIMSLLNEIKAKRFKSCFSLVSANMSITPDAVYFSTSFLPPLSFSLFFVARFSHRVREIYQISWAHSDFNTFMNCKNAQVWLDGCKGPPPRHTPLPPTNQLINIAMETKWQGIAFDFTEAGVIAPCGGLKNALCKCTLQRAEPEEKED